MSSEMSASCYPTIRGSRGDFKGGKFRDCQGRHAEVLGIILHADNWQKLADLADALGVEKPSSVR